VASIGLDITMGYPRFNFGNVDLMGGVGFIPAMIGMFGVSEVLRNVTHGDLGTQHTVKRLGSLFRGIGGVLNRYKINVLRGSVLGTAIGILPGAGADIAAWVSYGLSKRLSKEPEKFGTGHIEGIVGAGSANNAALGGAWIPALVFGIPGDSITAIVIGVLYMKGLQPGPLLYKRSPEMLYAVYLTFILANLMLLPMGYLAIKFSSRILAIPRSVLMPMILMFCIVGSFAINNTTFDVGVMLVMGLLAFVMEENDIPIAPAILGIVLGPLLEESFVVSMIKSEWNPANFFVRPMALALGMVAIGLWVSPFLYRLKALASNNREARDVP
jgi:TctA family transporter